jgi:ribosomal protein S18 acetylase RimI-like enzyme
LLRFIAPKKGLKIRLARRYDKDSILRFCTNTFAWGDYIDKVFDKWYNEPNGKLLVAENGVPNRSDNHSYLLNSTSLHSHIKSGTNITNTATRVKPVALSHVVLCPNTSLLWIEGIRVDPNYRRHKVATALIDKMLQYGKRRGAIEASAIISVNNIASNSLFSSMGFKVISKWIYYNIHVHNASNRTYSKTNKKSKIINERIASLMDIDNVWSYLKHSETYRLCGKRYFNEWRWYPLDYKTIVDFIKHHKLLIIENKDSHIEGLAIINTTTGYVDKNGIFQILYLDSVSTSVLQHLVSYCVDISASSIPYKKNNDNDTSCHSLKQLQIISHETSKLSKIMLGFDVKESAQFFLHSLPL